MLYLLFDNMGFEFNRKIIRVGNSSFGVIIPREWLRYYNLKYGDKVKIISNDDNELIIKKP